MASDRDDAGLADRRVGLRRVVGVSASPKRRGGATGRPLTVARLTRADLATELVGLAEAAGLLGVPRSTVAERRRAGTFPPAIAELACGPIFLRVDVERHARDYRPDRGGGSGRPRRV